jgi:peroxiredoxin
MNHTFFLTMIKWIGYLLAAMVIAAAASVCAASQTAATQLTISPGARALLDQVRAAYAGLKTLHVEGSIVGEFDIDGEKRETTANLVGDYDGTRFRSEIKNDAIAGSTGDQLYIFLPNSNTYLLQDVPKGPARLDAIDDDIGDVIRSQDYSLALALAPDAAVEITSGAQSITRVDQVITKDNIPSPGLKITREFSDTTLYFDSQTHLLRMQTIDEKKLALSQGAQNAKSAILTTFFTETSGSTIQAAAFAWSPPPGTQPIRHSPLEDKPLPGFSATGMDGSSVSSDDLKGSVCVLIFFQSRISACAGSLAETDQLLADFKDAGLKAFAIDLSESKETVAKFIAGNGVQTPVLLDNGTDLADAFGIDSVPTVVVADKNGIVRKVYVGSGHGDQIRRVIQRLLKQ